MSDCMFTATSQRIVMVPTAIVHAYDVPFRLAEAGEPQTPAWLEDEVCLVHEETSFSWTPIEPDHLGIVQHAIDAGCDFGCHCQCYGAVA